MKQVVPYIITTFLFLTAGCANRVTPTGGPRDVQAPVVLRTSPPDSSVQVSPQVITIEFDENIQVTSGRDQLRISPPAPQSLNVKSDRSKLLIELPDSLRQNTTYVIALDGAISDVHEGNVLRNLRYRFSTGSALDTLRISGVVRDAFSLQPMKGADVLAYRAEDTWDDSTVFKRLPDFSAHCNDSGAFILEGLPATGLRVFALLDKDGDLRFDDPSVEAIGKASRIIQVPVDSTLELTCSLEFPERPRLQRATRADRNAVVLAFNRPLKVPQVSYLEKTGSPVWYTSASGDTIYTFTDADSLKLLVSEQGVVVDTVKVRMTAPQGIADMQGKLRLSLMEIPRYAGDKRALRLQCGRPLRAVPSMIVIVTEKEDSLIATVTLSDSLRGVIDLVAAWVSGAGHRINILPAQFTDAFGVQNDSLSLNFTVPADDDLGAMTVQVKGWSDGRTGLLEVMNGDGAVLRTALIQRDSSIRFEALQPGPVRLRLIADQDGNGRWSPGKFMRGLDPEQVWFHPVTVLVRARWDVEAVFSINSIAR